MSTHQSAQLRHQRDMTLGRQLQQLVVLEVLHERGHICLLQLFLLAIRGGKLVGLLLGGIAQIAEVVPLMLLQEVVRLGVQHELLLLAVVNHLYAVVPDGHELVHHSHIQPLHEERSHGITLAIHDHKLAIPAVVEEGTTLVFTLDLVEDFASNTSS